MQAFLKNLEEVIKAHLKETYLPPHRVKTPGWTYHDLVFFSRGAEMLSTAFTEDRSNLPKNYFNKKEFRSAYLLYFVLTNAAKVWKCLEQTTPFLKPGPLKILDLGCGPGTAALACSAFFKERDLDIFGYEQNEGIKKDCLTLWKKLAPTNHHFRFVRYEIPKEKFDLTLAANFLSELPFKEQVESSIQALKHSRTFIIIEPALQKTTHTLMALRDRILETKAASVLAPCLHQQNCPMLKANKRDWCHFYMDWKCPEVIRHVDRFTGNKHDYLKMAYMIFRSSQPVVPSLKSMPSTWRVVSSPLISNGKKELILCGYNGDLLKISRLDKDKNFGNSEFDYTRRGDVIECHSSGRIGKEDTIKVLKKF